MVFFSFLLFSFLGGAEPYSWTLHSNATFISVWKCKTQDQAVALTLLTHPSCPCLACLLCDSCMNSFDKCYHDRYTLTTPVCGGDDLREIKSIRCECLYLPPPHVALRPPSKCLCCWPWADGMHKRRASFKLASETAIGSSRIPF